MYRFKQLLEMLILPHEKIIAWLFVVLTIRATFFSTFLFDKSNCSSIVITTACPNMSGWNTRFTLHHLTLSQTIILKNITIHSSQIQSVGVAVIIQVSKFFMLVYVCLHQFDKLVVIMQYKRQQALYCKGETSWLIRVCKKNKIKKTQRTKPVSWSLFVENQFSFFLALKPMRSSLVTKQFNFKMIKPVLFSNHYKIMYLALFGCKNKLSIDIPFDLLIFYSNWKLGARF